jgi:hypothetical protein
MNWGDAMGRASGRSSLLGHPNAKFFDENERQKEKERKTETSGASEDLRIAGR